MDFLAATALIDDGDIAGLGELIAATPAMAHHTYRHETPMSDDYCLLLHLVSWPAGRPNAGATAALLLAHGANPDVRYNGGESALHWAVSSPSGAAAVEALLDGGADVDAPGGVIRGGTPLMNAVHFGFGEIGQLLVERGASVHNLICAAGLGRLDLLAHWVGIDGTVSSEAMRAAPADAPPQDDDKHWLFSSLLAALMNAQYAAADWLVERGADLDFCPDNEEWGLLHHAGYCGSLPMAMYLCARGVDINRRTKAHDAPAFGFACAHGRGAVMNYLIDQGAEITTRDAAYCGRLDLVAIAADQLDADGRARLLAATIGSHTVIGKPLPVEVTTGRIAVARYLLQREPSLADVMIDGVTMRSLATEQQDAPMLAVLAETASAE